MFTDLSGLNQLVRLRGTELVLCICCVMSFGVVLLIICRGRIVRFFGPIVMMLKVGSLRSGGGVDHSRWSSPLLGVTHIEMDDHSLTVLIFDYAFHNSATYS